MEGRTLSTTKRTVKRRGARREPSLVVVRQESWSQTLPVQPARWPQPFHILSAVALGDVGSLALLKGSESDFVDELAGAEFRVRNPNAKSSCGCGVSFSI